MRYLILLLVVCLCFSCKKERPSAWDTEWLVPLVDGSVRPLEALPEEFIAIDGDGTTHILIVEDVKLEALDQLASIPDTTIKNGYTLGFLGGPFDIPAGFEFVADQEGFDLTNDQADLRKIVFKAGDLILRLRNDVDGIISADISLPSATLNGDILSYSTTMPPGTSADPATDAVTFDLAGYELDLTGADGGQVNQMLGSIFVNTLSDASVFGTDSVVAEFEFKDVMIEYALGYFGQYEETFEQTFDFEGMNFIQQGSISPEAIDLQLEVSNPVGIDVLLHLDELSSIPLEIEVQQVALDHEIVGGGIQLARAYDNAGVPEYETGIYNITNQNSNLIEFISSSPQGVNVAGSVEINPLGNVSGSNDFYYCEYPLAASLRLDVPLCVDFDEFLLRDTLDFSSGDLDGVKSGILFLSIESTMPLESNISISPLLEDATTYALIADQSISASVGGATVQSAWEIEVTQEDIETLKKTNFLVAYLSLNTEGDTFAKLSLEDKIDIQLRGKFVYEVEF